MNQELIGERKYIQSVQDQDGVWVLMKANTAYAVVGDGGNSVGTWNSLEDADDFAIGLKMDGLKGIFVPLNVFVKGWLLKEELNITEIMASPRHGFPALTYTAQEFINAVKT
jgi:hypothetical protein